MDFIVLKVKNYTAKVKLQIVPEFMVNNLKGTDSMLH